MKRTISNVILEPVITEKSTALSQQNKYTFQVSKTATKHNIKSAFQAIFPDRKVLSIQTVKTMGHKKRTKGGYKNPIDGKKALITIEGPRIEFFPEAS